MFHKFSLNVLRSSHLQVPFSPYLPLTSFQRNSFASLRKTLYNLFNQNDVKDPNYIAASFNPLVPLEVRIFLIKMVLF